MLVFVLAIVVYGASRYGPPFSLASPVRTATADPCHVDGVTYCVLNPDVTSATTSTTICSVGWTSTIRPSSSYTSPLKVKQIADEHLADTNPADYEEDHRLPLELGGAPADPFNLSPEPHQTSYTKDAAENAAKHAVCAGADLRATQAAFVKRWLAPYPAYA